MYLITPASIRYRSVIPSVREQRLPAGLGAFLFRSYEEQLMATITGAANEKVYSIGKWLGLNEHPDGDTNLKLGEAAKMVNWKITRDGNLKRRPGMEFFAGLNESYVVNPRNGVQPTGAVQSILDGLKGTDSISVYGSATAMAPPGTVTLIGTSGVVEKGVYTIEGAAIGEDGEEDERGVLLGSGDLEFSVNKGVLHPLGYSDYITIAELAELLSELEDGNYLYTRVGEMPYALRNDSLTQTGNTYKLSGYAATADVVDSTAKPVAGLWSGMVGGKQVLLAAGDGNLWSLYDSELDSVSRTFIYSINTDKGVNFIPFDNKVYIQNGYEYYVYDGLTCAAVDGYIPLVAISIGPQGTGDAGELTGEYVNRLTVKRRVRLSPDGDVHKTFRLPEPAHSIVGVWDLSTNPKTLIPDTDYTFTADTTDITFTRTLTAAANSIEVEYAVAETDETAAMREQVTSNLFCEIFSGGTDSALLFYGNGTNKVLYTGMDYDGMPRPDYFPDQYEVLVGDANTPVTSLIRHYAVLVAYKPDSAWALSYGTAELATGDLTVAIHVTPVNRDKGNDAPGQVRLVNNNPVTCSGSELYQWTNSSYYTSNLTRDERQARRISDRIQSSIKEIDFKNCCMWDDNDGQEFYISGNGVTLVWNYVTDCWYRYKGLDAVIMCNFHGDVIVGRSDGKIFRLTYDKETDDGILIDAEWESGSMDFGASNMRKYSSMMWIGLKPVAGASVDVCVVTDRKETFREKIVSADKAKVPGQPFPVRSKIKAKKFTFYKLLLSVDRKMPAVTITNVDFRVRQTGYSK